MDTMQKDILLAAKIKDVCTLLDTKASKPPFSFSHPPAGLNYIFRMECVSWTEIMRVCVCTLAYLCAFACVCEK